MTLRIAGTIVAIATAVVAMVWIPAAVPTSGSRVRRHLADGLGARG